MVLKKVDQIAGIDLLDRQTQKADGRSKNKAFASKDHVDAINQMFAEFELAYHNQYHKAFSDEASLKLAKKYWLSCLSTFPAALLVKATRELVKTQSYLPTVANMVDICQKGLPIFGLPAVHEAYLEACRMPSPKSDQQWSHVAVYLAGKNTGWFELASLPEGQIFPLFDYHYSWLAQKVLQGEDLQVSSPKPLPESNAVPLSAEDNLSRLKKLKQSLHK